ncbi:MAG: cyclic pyranopterin monophosphate synthase MoaC [Candidatus Aegiribacteria sp.]|nr:cyclic pyranopterin monophosphate synthase MoaC [Candidatus Aegiribacteria sp.]
MKKMSHIDKKGNARMVDVSSKEPTERTAVASGCIKLGKNASDSIDDDSVPKGDVFAAARIAAIQAVKKTWETIPLCHPIRIGGTLIELVKDGTSVTAVCTVKGIESTGYEMEALVGVTTALLTVYDMTKALDREMEITDVRLLRKSGGKSGEYIWQG